jgi:hypothetical protein
VNYEDPTQRSHKLVVIVTDHLGLKYQQEFVFDVINTNEPPYVRHRFFLSTKEFRMTLSVSKRNLE